MKASACFLPLLLLASLCLHIADSASSCPTKFTASSGSTSTTTIYSLCQSLPELSATLSWSYHSRNGSVDLAFRAKPGTSTGWVAWGINPAGKKMVGTQALIALRFPNGTMSCKTYNVTSKQAALVPSAISFSATHLSSMYENGMMTIFATVVLPSNKSKVNQVWQVGNHTKGLDPLIHDTAAANLKSFSSIDLASTKSTTKSSGSPASTSTSNGSIPRISLTALLFFLGFSGSMFYYI